MTEWSINRGNTEELGIEKHTNGFPWRRWLARGIDLGICSLLWWTVAFFILQLNVLGWNVRNVIIPFAIMLAIEPVMLSVLGTTIGKALLGILVTDKSGKKLSLGQSFYRTCRVLSRGYGFVIIPIYNLYRMYKSYKECKEYGQLQYDANNKITVTLKDKKPIRILAVLTSYTLVLVLMLMVAFVAQMPHHRGNINGTQFLDNVQRYARFHNIIASGALTAMPYELDIVETDGIVTKISFEIIDGSFSDVWGLEHWVRAYMVSFIGAQEGMNFWNLYIARDNPLSELFPHFWEGWVHSSHSCISHGVEVIYHIEVDGVAEWTIWTPNSSVSVWYSMRKI